MYGERDTAMKMIERLVKPYGLKARFGISLLISGILCGLLFIGLYNLSEYVLTYYFEESPFESMRIELQVENLQEFIAENEISSENIEELKKWEKLQPVSFMEIYAGNRCIYSSFKRKGSQSAAYYQRDNLVRDHSTEADILLADTEAKAFLSSNFTYQYYIWSTFFIFALSLILFIALFLRSNGKLIHYISKLNDEVQILEGGNLDYQVTVQGHDEITDLAESMNRMKESFREQMETEQMLHQANRRLVTEMSHDLRTPLTGILLYLEILRSGRYENEAQMKDYLEKIDQKAHHMKLLSDHLFEYSLEGLPDRQEEPVTMEQAFKKPIENLIADLQTNGFSAVSELEWEPCFVQVTPSSVQRIFENIASNVRKYAANEAEVRISSFCTDAYLGISVMNLCLPEPEPGESNRIGIESIRTRMQEMGGSCTVEQTESVFEMTLLFPKR